MPIDVRVLDDQVAAGGDKRGVEAELLAHVVARVIGVEDHQYRRGVSDEVGDLRRDLRFRRRTRQVRDALVSRALPVNDVDRDDPSRPE
jgi:hypothetical protein